MGEIRIDPHCKNSRSSPRGLQSSRVFQNCFLQGKCRLPGRREILAGLWPLTTGLATSAVDEQWIYLLVECPNGSSLVVFHRDENRHAVLG